MPYELNIFKMLHTGIEQNLIYSVDQNINAVVIQRKGGGNYKLFIEWKQKMENEKNFLWKTG